MWHANTIRQEFPSCRRSTYLTVLVESLLVSNREGIFSYKGIPLGRNRTEFLPSSWHFSVDSLKHVVTASRNVKNINYRFWMHLFKLWTPR